MTHKNIVIVIAADVVYVVYFCIFGPYFEIVFFGKTSIKLFSKCQIFIQFLLKICNVRYLAKLIIIFQY